MSEILFEKIDSVGIIKLNRPTSLNAFTRTMAEAFQDLLDELAADKSVRAIIITGVGRAFSSGQDIAEGSAPGALTISQIVRTYYNPIIRRLRKIEKPIIAAINGVAAGAAANIAFACDIVLAAKSAKFIQAFSMIGLIPDSGGTFFLPRLVGMGRAAAISFLAERISAEEAEKWGMIWKVYENKELMDNAIEMAKKLSELPTVGIGLTKKAFNASWSNSLDMQLEYEELLQGIAGDSKDSIEGIKAFLEKRPPNFVGE